MKPRLRRGRSDRSALGERATTLHPKASLAERVRAAALHPVAPVDRPQTREDCRDGARPCPFVACKYNAYLDINPSGTIKLNFPDLEPWEMDAENSCVLDVADRGGITLDEVGVRMNITRERVRQVEVRGLMRLKFPLRVSGQDDE